MASNPVESTSFKRGRGGRPTRNEAERRHRDLLGTARRLFLEKGWDGVSVDEISRQSGVAKRFIYGRYPDKAALFVAALQMFIDEHIGALHPARVPPEDVEEGLIAFGRQILDFALNPEALVLQRRFIAEATRFPDLARGFVARNRHRSLGEIMRVLATYIERGAIHGDAEARAEHFFILVAGIPQRLAMLVGREPPADEDKRLRAAVRLFLDGCRVRPSG
jgi:AcrR family transcriptional regulator